MCYNCGPLDHLLKDCPIPFNQDAIDKRKAIYLLILKEEDEEEEGVEEVEAVMVDEVEVVPEEEAEERDLETLRRFPLEKRSQERKSLMVRHLLGVDAVGNG